jgi:hypothetical protein
VSASGATLLLLSALLGIGFGYAAQRGSLCAVLGVEQWIEHRSTRQLVAFLHCSLWVALVTVPLAWLGSAHLAAAIPITIVALLGGLLFGAGAALNGGCSFGTIIRLGGGDATYLATIAGMAMGIAFHLRGPGGLAPPPALGTSILESPTPPALALFAGLLALLAWEVRRVWHAAGDGHRWAPERAAALMGVTGGLLYALNGAWAYTVALERGLGVTMAGGIASPVLAVIFVASVLGAGVSAWRRRVFTARFRLRAVPSRFAGGLVMGAAAGLIPGGNDALVLHAIPALSPHVLVAYPGLIAGAALMLAAGRSTAWSHVASATPLRALRSLRHRSKDRR